MFATAIGMICRDSPHECYLHIAANLAAVIPAHGTNLREETPPTPFV